VKRRSRSEELDSPRTSQRLARGASEAHHTLDVRAFTSTIASVVRPASCSTSRAAGNRELIILTSIPAVVRECWHSREVGRKLCKGWEDAHVRDTPVALGKLFQPGGIRRDCVRMQYERWEWPFGHFEYVSILRARQRLRRASVHLRRLHEIVLGKFRLWRARSEGRLRHGLCRTNRTLYAVGCTRQRFLRADVPIEQRL